MNCANIRGPSDNSGRLQRPKPSCKVGLTNSYGKQNVRNKMENKMSESTCLDLAIAKPNSIFIADILNILTPL